MIIKTGFICGDCKSEITRESDSCSTGYGIDKNDRKICFKCCAEDDKKQMREQGKISLYLTFPKGSLANIKVNNWPGSLSFPIHYVRNGRHNIAGKRYDVWFSFEGTRWHGVKYGDMTDICHCKRIK